MKKLIGSEKEIKWANDLLVKFNDYVKEEEKNIDDCDDDEKEEFYTAKNKMEKILSEETIASYLICIYNHWDKDFEIESIENAEKYSSKTARKELNKAV